ncbi:type II secretion system F family protein [Glacieibacterium megasporae]|uniref:type II secretion system F family protein n=1 Tax=Glacieibacterium megasporae TaxID=2835787 RepID=UPI001C1E3BB3|nr:type II secretion system F family protein [Polymorphobacter megasporae]UAJ08714.1 type II secretion system F family protein [Polymorphobacter megasporae]
MIAPIVAQGLLIAVVFAAGCLLFLGLAPLFANKVDLRHRLAGTTAPTAAPRASLRVDQGPSLGSRLVRSIEKRGVSLADSKPGVHSEKLVQAGFTQPHAARLFMLVRTILTLVLPAVGATIVLLTSDPKPMKLYMIVAGLAFAGLYLPGFYVGSRAASRGKAILNGFPDTLDLMLVCVEAGLGIDACFTRVGQEVRRSHPLLANEFAVVALELRAGRSREDALKGLVRRTGVAEIGSFVTLIIQSDKLGSSIAQALKCYAIEMREARKMRAEEKAHRLPVLISIPLVAFMLPTMIAVLILPGAILVKRDLLPSFANAGK